MSRVISLTDVSLVRTLLQAGFPRQEWSEQDAEERLNVEGIHLVDPGKAYVHLTFPKMDDTLPPIPPGLCTHIQSLLPQHHDQKWVDDTLFPLLADAIRKVPRKRPKLLDRPLYGLLIPSLMPFWEGKLGSIVSDRRGHDLIYVPTLREAIGKIR